uniref:Glycoside hydrolase family 5 domain-containing protein n=1 Tax=Globisporangium ultimum (strain ATCC 200006 / CBS 805.95 / DAOM BR144) TaxID=431595 RepID=K3WC24_GLOUD
MAEYAQQKPHYAPVRPSALDPHEQYSSGKYRSTIVTTEQGSGNSFYDSHPSSASDSLMLSGGGLNTTFAGRATEMKLTAFEPDGGMPDERPRDYKGRYRRWPGVVLFLALVGAAVALITLHAINKSDTAAENQTRFEFASQNKRKIQDGLNNSVDLIDDDGQVGNPKKYPDMGCELPNYLSKNGQIIAQSKNGTEVPVAIKGVNWFGMETGMRIPFGLWENSENGTSTYEISSFLARNKFNSVRLPVCIKSILDDIPPSKDLINMNTNRAMNVSTYMSTIKSIVKALAYRHVTVMISLHTLDTKVSGGAWYSDKLDVTEDQFLEAVDMLTSNLCSEEYWNILGLDLKNEPHECSWGGAAPDWQKGATLIGNHMLKGCKNWMAFVEGINKQHTFNMATVSNGTAKRTYFDWWGGGLQGVASGPVVLATEGKVVYAPHYYNTGVNPADYLYGGGTLGAASALLDYVELDDETLKNNVEATFNDMFGYIAKDKKDAVVLGEFAGLYGKDQHPKLTTKRTTDFTIQAMLDAGLAGGYMWSLNPESAYQFNPADTYGHFTEGLLSDDWLSPNKVFLEGMAKMDALPDLRAFPCFPQEVST